MSDFTPSSNTRATQQAAILAALISGPLSTVTAREVLGVLHPAGRVLELKRLGYNIQTLKVTRHDAEGRAHTCAEYSLETESEGGDND